MPVEIDTGREQDEAIAAPEAGDHAAAEIDQAADDTRAPSIAEDVKKPEGSASDYAQAEDAEVVAPQRRNRKSKLTRAIAFWILPCLALVFAITAGTAKWQDMVARDSVAARVESLTAAKESTVALLSYRPDTVEKDLGAARDRLTGTFKDSYTQLIHDVVIPGAKKQQISAIATVPAAAFVSATRGRAVALVFVNQTITVAQDAPTNSTSAVRVTLDKVGGRWLISQFDPV